MDGESNNSNTQGGNKNMLMVAIAAIIIILAVAGGGYVLSKNRAQNTVQTPQDNTANETTPETNDVGASYNDGTYTADGTYSYHSGTETIGVTITLANGIIEDAEVVSKAKAPTSKEKQADFIANYKPMVVGKNIDELNLGKVSGSSLTPIGFNNAIEDIRSQAKGS
jgi:uncharacterized protein with FMN-binding domain